MAVDEKLWNECVRVARGVPQPGQQGRLPRLLGTVDGNRVLVVDFNEVKVRDDNPKDTDENREHMDTDEGANDIEAARIRREFGKNVLLLDWNIHPRCWPYILYHEAHERRLMLKGWSYAKAHNSANAAEKELRLRGMKK